MEPTSFDDVNVTFKGQGYTDLPAYKGDDGIIITRWRPSLRERLKVLFGGPVWVAILSDHIHPIAVAGGTCQFVYPRRVRLDMGTFRKTECSVCGKGFTERQEDWEMVEEQGGDHVCPSCQFVVKADRAIAAYLEGLEGDEI